MKFRYLIYALLCSIFGCASAHAQNTQPQNCSVILDNGDIVATCWDAPLNLGPLADVARLRGCLRRGLAAPFAPFCVKGYSPTASSPSL